MASILDFNTLEASSDNYIVVDGYRFYMATTDNLTIAQQVKLTNINKTAASLFERFQNGDVTDEEGEQMSVALDRLVRAILTPDDPKTPKDILGRLRDSHRVQIINSFTELSRPEAETPSSESTGKTPSPDSIDSTESVLMAGVTA